MLPGGFAVLWRDCFPLLWCWWCRSFFLLADGNGLFLIAIISPSVSETPRSLEDLKVKCTCVGAVSPLLKCEFLQAGKQQLFRSLVFAAVPEPAPSAGHTGRQGLPAPCAPCLSCKLRCWGFLQAGGITGVKHVCLLLLPADCPSCCPNHLLCWWFLPIPCLTSAPRPRAGSPRHPGFIPVSCGQAVARQGGPESRDGLGWKGPSKITQSNPAAMGRDIFHYIRLFKAPSSLALSPSRDGASTAALGSLCQRLTAPITTQCFLMSSLTLPSSV